MPHLIFWKFGGIKLNRKYRYINFPDREKIEKMSKAGESLQAIADEIGVSVSTVYRELHRGCTDDKKKMRYAYSAKKAQETLKKNFSKRGRKKKEE